MTDNGTDSVPIPRAVVHDRTLSHRAYRVYCILRDHAWTLRLAKGKTHGDLSISDAPIDELMVLVGCGESQLRLHLGDLDARDHVEFHSAGRIVTVTFPDPKVVTMLHLPAGPTPANAVADSADPPAAIPENPESGGLHGGDGSSDIEEGEDIDHHHHIRKNRNDSGKTGMAGPEESPSTLADPGDAALQNAADAVYELLVKTTLVPDCDPVWPNHARRFILRNGARNVLAWFMWYRNPVHREGLRKPPVHALSKMLGSCETPPDGYLPPQLCKNCGRVEAYCTCSTPALFTPVESYVAAAQSDPNMVVFANPWGICPTCHGLYDLSCTCADDRAGTSEADKDWRVREIAAAPQTGDADSATGKTGGLAVPVAPMLTAGVSYLLPVTSETEDNPAAAKIWSTALQQLSMQMTPATYNTWVKHSSGLDYADGVFVVGVMSDFAKDWIENRLNKTIKRTLGNVLGHAVNVRYVVLRSESEESGASGYFRGQCVRQPGCGIGVVQSVVPTERGTMEVVVQFSDKIKRFETQSTSP